MEADAYQAELLFSQNYSQYSTMLYRLAMIYLGNAYDAEEADVYKRQAGIFL